MRVLPYGRSAVLVEMDDPAVIPQLQRALAGRPEVVEAVAGATTVLAVSSPGALAAVRAAVREAVDACERTDAAPGPLVELPVTYDGPDLASVADAARLTIEEVVARHCAGSYTVRFCGFSPGFAYLDGLDPALHVARRVEPRTRVPAGAVGVAGPFTGVYPRASPGGWQLLGRTAISLWDLARDPPALLPPGTRVRFRAVRAP